MGRFCTFLVVASAALSLPAAADDAPFPPRSAWRATSSASTAAAMVPPMAIDGDPTTRWGGSFAAEQWLQVDLKSVASVGGILLHWDSGFAASYRILASPNGQEWQTVFETFDGQGGIEYVFFPPTLARYLRLASMPLSADWGVSMLEIEPLAAAETPTIEGLESAEVPAAKIWQGGTAPPLPLARAATLTIDLPRAFPTTGLEVYWGAPWRAVSLQARDERGRWRLLASDRTPPGEGSLLAAREPVTATALRLKVTPEPGKPAAISRLRLLSPDRTMTPLRRYEVAASRAYRELFPLTVRNKQVYWTVVGVPAGPQKSLFDEFGNLEPYKGGPLVQPLWRDAQHRLHAAHGATVTQTLREGWMPLPSVEWEPEPGLSLRSDAMTLERSGQPITLVRHRLENRGSAPRTGDLLLLVRPVQINPAWQSGGASPIHTLTVEGTPEETTMRVNERLLLESLTPVSTRGAAGFGVRGEEELTHTLASGTFPTARKAHDDDGLAGGYLHYALTLAPGEKRDVVVAFPLGTKPTDALGAGEPPPPAPPIERAALLGKSESAGAAFDTLADELARTWQERLGAVQISLPDRTFVDMLRAQIAYMLINQTGPAIHPGPRNYNRSFIRDGSATAALYLRMGLASRAREYLRWYAEHALHDNGLVSPILNQDGTVNRGFGSDLEHDSQGQFVGLVADVARLDGGPQTVREYLGKVRLALRFQQQLRERTLGPGYLTDREAPERFFGIIAPSISHEGYSVPTHSYWDDFFALKGWRDGAWLAGALGDSEMQAWARREYQKLYDAVAASVRATMAWRKSEHAPSSADLGEYDPTSTSIAFDPCDVQEVLPSDALQRTYDRYLEDVRKRQLPGSLWAYTPYELRTVLSYVRMNRPRDAIELLESFMPHRRPKGWQMFAEVVHSRLRHPGYLGDMPHTWGGGEYVRAVLGMLMHEEEAQLELLPGAPQAWVQGDGIRVRGLRTAFGPLNMTAQSEGTQLSIELGPGLDPSTSVRVFWPMRLKPERVLVDGERRSNQTDDGIVLERPFKLLVARW